MKLPNKVYDILKWLVILFIPGFATFYGNLAGIWNLPYVDEIPKTLIAADTFLGAIIGISTMSYNAEKKQNLHLAKVLNGQEDKNED